MDVMLSSHPHGQSTQQATASGVPQRRGEGRERGGGGGPVGGVGVGVRPSPPPSTSPHKGRKSAPYQAGRPHVLQHTGAAFEKRRPLSLKTKHPLHVIKPPPAATKGGVGGFFPVTCVVVVCVCGVLVCVCVVFKMSLLVE